MRQIPLDIPVATDGTPLPSKNLLKTARVITGILSRKENEQGSSEVGFFCQMQICFEISMMNVHTLNKIKKTPAKILEVFYTKIAQNSQIHKPKTRDMYPKRVLHDFSFMGWIIEKYMKKQVFLSRNLTIYFYLLK